VDFRDTGLGGLAGLAAAVRGGDVSARELLSAALARIEAVDGKVGAFVAVDGERAMAEALAVDERVAAGDDVGPLAGIPIGVKDLEEAAGFRTTKGSLLHAADPVATADSPLVARLRAAGCVVVGKTNTPELGFRGDTVNRVFPPTRNPWDLARSPGGSSGGSAAAVAAGMVPLGTGSDGGGSIRIPSALCGLSGLKPSLGRVPTGGLEPPDWPTVSTRGVIARTAADVAVAYDVVVGPDPTDVRSLPAPPVPWSSALASPAAGAAPARVAWSPTLGYANVDREVLAVCSAAVARLEGAGVEVVEVEKVFDEDPVWDWLAVVSVAGLRVMERHRGTDAWDLLDPTVARILDRAADRVSAVELARAEDAGHRLNLALVDVFRRAPLLLTPTVAGQTPYSGRDGTVDGVPDPSWVSFTYPFNLTRSPAGTVCAGFTGDGMPVGLQIVGPQHADVEVLAMVAHAEQVLGPTPIAPLP
jgi:aspartyl-tRNA(Asn)/glutamyl-tRNA(Gln) amidotransferase subunit A